VKHILVAAASLVALINLTQQDWWLAAIYGLLGAAAALLYAPETVTRRVVQGVLLALAMLCAVLAAVLAA
jgi:uncharacterized membrane protein HdeD (DUF308 family)